MSTLLVFAATLMGSTSLWLPNQISQEAKKEQYVVCLTWINSQYSPVGTIVSEGAMVKMDLPIIANYRPYPEDEDLAEESEPRQLRQPAEMCECFIQVQRLNSNQVRLNLSLQKFHLEKAIPKGLFRQAQGFSLQQKVTLNKVHKIVLHREKNGEPESWLQIQVQGIAPVTATDPEFSEEEIRSLFEIRPFWFEPH